nr:hypothetical protein [Tanacetum cinerariifolium]
MSILRSNARWKAKDFYEMTFEQIEEKFIPVCENMQDVVPMNSKLESERLKKPRIQLDKETSKKLKTTKASGTEPTQEHQYREPKELSKEDFKKMMDLDLSNVTITLQAKVNILFWKLDLKMRLSVPTADVYIAKKVAIVEDFALLHEDK